MLGDKRLIQSIQLRNLLSFGPDSAPLELKSLNVLIGPNSSGKSNLIEALDVLRATPRDVSALIRDGGGVADWLWKGTRLPPIAELDVIVQPPQGLHISLRHLLAFTMEGQRFKLEDERIEHAERDRQGAADVYFYYRYLHGNPMLNVRSVIEAVDGGEMLKANRVEYQRNLRRQELAPNQSVLAQRKGPEQYPEITYLGDNYARIQLYREWNLGRYTPPRLPQKADLPNDFLLDDASNLGLVLNDLNGKPDVKPVLEEKLREFHEPFVGFHFNIQGGTVQINLLEKGLRHPVPATRLSDGTLRYLCLLAVLCHPEPPPLIAIEEPELGLHPDMLPILADLLIQASHRTQLVVTTHSDTLVDALSHVPEAVVVCEKEEGSTVMHRLKADALQEWLQEYGLGQLWRRGQIGGNRW